MSLRLCVFDFDGTLTDAEEEAKPYLEGYKKDLAAILNKDLEEIVQEWDRAVAEIARVPEQFGWRDEKGRILAPAQADPYALCRTIAHSLFDHYGVYQTSDQQAHLMKLLFRANYSLTPVFKDGVFCLISQLEKFAYSSGLESCIITNTDQARARAKLSCLSNYSPFHLPVYGSAKKYTLDDSWEAVPESIAFPGFERPTYLRRRMYGELLQSLMAPQESQAEHVMVVGDLFEMDLALPMALGMHVILMPKQTTPDYECVVVQNYKRGYVAKDIHDVLRHIKKHVSG